MNLNNIIFKLVFYSFNAFSSMYFMYKNKYVDIFYNFKINTVVKKEKNIKLKIFIILSSYMYYIWEIVTLPKKRKDKDYKMMQLHHLVTLSIMTYSIYHNLSHYFIYFIGLHQISDFFYNLLKLCKYYKLDRNSNPTNRNIIVFLFTCFCLSWFYYRLIIFPLWLYNHYYSDNIMYKNGAMIIFFLFPLHVIWFYFLINGLMKYKRSGILFDSRAPKEKKNSDVNN